VVGVTPLVAYTDGSGTRAHLPAGAGVVVFDGEDIVFEASRHLGLGSNNHAELSAIGIAIYVSTFDPFASRALLIRTDSEYALNMLRRSGTLKPHRPNAHLITYIRKMLRNRDVTFEHVRGHAGIPGNERADTLAGLARLRFPKGAPMIDPSARHA